ncbi:MAG: GntR family transcriptional regulator [Marivita sp. XM-24bin2]|nr:MAG: GntR family transcriptional regulator [Marivita sp. XM-24bin2]
MVYHLRKTLAKAIATINNFWYTKSRNLIRGARVVGSEKTNIEQSAEVSLPERIAAQLRRDILNGKYAPGATIKERDNAAELGVSRTPMREAIRILAKDGLLVLRPARSPIVAQPSFKQIADNIEVLTALELLSADLACRVASDAQINDIVAAQDRFERQYDVLEPVEVFELDMQVHLAIARASNNEVLIDTHRSILARMWRARFLSARRQDSRDRVLRQHSMIIDGLKRRDPDMVRNILSDHLEHILIKVRDYFEHEDAEATKAS